VELGLWRRVCQTHEDAAAMSSRAKYSGLNNTAIASFQPNTAKAPYIHSGTCATDDTMLRLASTYAASASRLNRVSSCRSLVAGNKVNAVEGSNDVGSASVSKDGSGDGRSGRRESSEGEMVAKRGSKARVWGKSQQSR
jgi:hypothetical protein